MTLNKLDLSEFQLDALREATNIGAAHAATALSQLLGLRVTLQVPTVEVTTIQHFNLLGHDPNTVVAAVYLKVLEDVPGKAVFLFDPDSARRIVSLLNGQAEQQTLLEDELALSALKEVGNILLGSFLAALVRFTKLRLNFSVPAVAVDMAGAIFDGVMLDGEFSDDWVCMATEFTGNHVSGILVFLPDSHTLSNLLGAMGV